MKRFFLLLSPDPADGAGAPPPAAETVLNSDAKEGDAAEIVRLKRECEGKDKTIKDRETRIAEIEDENRRLKNPEVVPIKQATAQKKGFLDGATFFG